MAEKSNDCRLPWPFFLKLHWLFSGGELLGIRPGLLLVGSSNLTAAKKIIEAQLIKGGESNINYRAVKEVNTDLVGKVSNSGPKGTPRLRYW